MKKFILSITFTCLIVMCVLGLSSVGADTVDSLDWEAHELGSDYYISASIVLEEGTKSVSIYIPNTSYTRSNLSALSTNGLSEFRVGYIDGGVLSFVDFGEWSEYDYIMPNSGYLEDFVEFEFNFSAYDIPESATGFYISIPSLISATGLETVLDADSYYTCSTSELPIGIISIALNDMRYNYPDASHDATRYVSNVIEIPTNTDSITFIGQTTFYQETFDHYDYIIYYDDNMQVVRSAEMSNASVVCDSATEYCHDWFPFNVVSKMDVAWEFYGYNESTSNVKYIQFVFYDYYAPYGSNYPFNTIEANIRDSWYILDGDIVQVNYIANGEIIDDMLGVIGVRSTFRESLMESPDGKDFSHWIDEDGNVFDPYMALTDEMVSNGIANFYAIFVDEPSPTNPVVIENTPDGGIFEVAMDDMGFNDAPERVIVFALAVIMPSIILLGLRVPIFNIIVVDACIIAFFMSLGLIPVFVSAVIIIVVIFLAWKFVMSGSDA